MGIQGYAELFGFNFLRHSPVLLLGIFGVWRAVIYKERLARAYPSALWGFAILGVHAVLAAVRDVAAAGVRYYVATEGLSLADVGVVLMLLELPSYFALLAALVLMSRAVLLARDSDAALKQRFASSS